MYKTIFLTAWIICWFILALIYVRIAKRYHIVDRPNERSSHRKLTIRGGGILLFLAALVGCFFLRPFPYLLFVAFLLVGTVSFVDDLIQVSTGKRLAMQLISVYLIVLTWSLDLPISLLIISYVVLVIVGGGLVNLYNFMDGINGLNAFHTLVLAGTLMFFDDGKEDFYLVVMAACLVMMLFNMRSQGKAVFFSGDVGSVSAGLFAFAMVGGLCIKTENLLFILLLAVYLTDSIWTIIMRLYRRENIFIAHRYHLFQVLTNQLGWSHVTVCSIYVVSQLVINLLVFINYEYQLINDYLLIGSVVGGLTVTYHVALRRIGFLVK